MATRPSSARKWAESADPGDISEPTAERPSGYLENERQPHDQFNWFMQTLFNWVDYFDDIFNNSAETLDMFGSYISFDVGANDESFWNQLDKEWSGEWYDGTNVNYTSDDHMTAFLSQLGFTGVTRLGASELEVANGMYFGPDPGNGYALDLRSIQSPGTAQSGDFRAKSGKVNLIDVDNRVETDTVDSEGQFVEITNQGNPSRGIQTRALTGYQSGGSGSNLNDFVQVADSNLNRKDMGLGALNTPMAEATIWLDQGKNPGDQFPVQTTHYGWSEANGQPEIYYGGKNNSLPNNEIECFLSIPAVDNELNIWMQMVGERWFTDNIHRSLHIKSRSTDQFVITVKDDEDNNSDTDVGSFGAGSSAYISVQVNYRI